LERLKKLCKPKGIAHITGGGLLENLPRVIPEGLKCEIHTDSWEVPPVIGFIVERGGVEVREAYRTFNMGIGLVTAFSPDDADAVLQGMKDEKPVEIGVVVAGGVVLRFAEEDSRTVSGNGSNLERLIELSGQVS
jgi:phosphoribosylaminoimidazole (AIR) synthetase